MKEPFESVGVGRTDRLLEMSGPAAEWSPYTSLSHLIVVPHTPPNMPMHARLRVARYAGTAAAVYLAQVSFGMSPVTTKNFDSVGPTVGGREGQPRVAYVGQIYSRQRSPEADEQIVYGVNTSGMMPLLLHPDEWLDGAVVPSYVLFARWCRNLSIPKSSGHHRFVQTSSGKRGEFCRDRRDDCC